jgi:hypothetical protein
MDLEIMLLSERSQAKEYMYDFIYIKLGDANLSVVTGSRSVVVQRQQDWEGQKCKQEAGLQRA